MRAKMRRMWINQPSTLQQFHKYHGTNVLADEAPNERGVVTVWFLSGDTWSMDILEMALSKGWTKGR